MLIIFEFGKIYAKKQRVIQLYLGSRETITCNWGNCSVQIRALIVLAIYLKLNNYQIFWIDWVTKISGQKH